MLLYSCRINPTQKKEVHIVNKRTALTLARKLTALDRQSDRLLSRDETDWAMIDAVEAKQIELVK